MIHMSAAWDWIDERFRLSALPAPLRAILAVVFVTLLILPNIFVPSRLFESVLVSLCAAAFAGLFVFVVFMLVRRFGGGPIFEYTCYALILAMIAFPLLSIPWSNIHLGSGPSFKITERTIDGWMVIIERDLINYILFLVVPIAGFFVIRTMFSDTREKVETDIATLRKEAAELERAYGLKPVPSSLPMFLNSGEFDRLEGTHRTRQISLEKDYTKGLGYYLTLRMPIRCKFYLEVAAKQRWFGGIQIRDGRPILSVSGDSEMFDKLASTAPEITKLFHDPNLLNVSIEPGKLSMALSYDEDDVPGFAPRKHIKRIAPLMIDGAMKLADAIELMRP